MSDSDEDIIKAAYGIGDNNEGLEEIALRLQKRLDDGDNDAILIAASLGIKLDVKVADSTVVFAEARRCLDNLPDIESHVRLHDMTILDSVGIMAGNQIGKSLLSVPNIEELQKAIVNSEEEQAYQDRLNGVTPRRKPISFTISPMYHETARRVSRFEKPPMNPELDRVALRMKAIRLLGHEGVKRPTQSEIKDRMEKLSNNNS